MVIPALADGRVVAAQRRLVSRVALLVAVCGALTGCFYVDPINQRPGIRIDADSTVPVFRGDHVMLAAIADDPDGDYISFNWRVYACTDASDPATSCDADPFYTELLQNAAFDVPVLRNGMQPTESLRVVLEAKDELGATAKPSQELLITVLNRPPDLVVDKVSRYGYVKGTPISLFAKVSDLDDGKDHVTLTWVVYAPSAVGHTLTDLPMPPSDDPMALQYAKQFIPAGVGDWDIEVTAKDPLGNATVQHLLIAVADDKAPCIAQLVPIVAMGGAALPLTEATLFSAPVVIDDLDIYPPAANDQVLGTTRFAWSIQGPTGGLHDVIAGATSNSIVVDPAAYTPGDIIEVRVELFDRQNATLPCADAEATCSIATPQSCIQRQTWKVEVR
jgi:hypothetical protein